MKPPRTAYILLWFPKPSETFIFREVVSLWDMGLPLKVFSLYGPARKALSPEMLAASPRVERLGLPYLKKLPADLIYWFKRDPLKTDRLIRKMVFRRWSGLEKTGESFWAFLCAFHLARRFEEENIEHIHAPWASGPATAAWLASQLTGIPFSFTARAWDIYPPDGALLDKIADAALVRSETGYNIKYMERLSGSSPKFRLTYNGVPLKAQRESAVDMTPPLKLLALGRFVGKKGYKYLLAAAKTLKDEGLDFRLTLAGDGPLAGALKKQTHELGLDDSVFFPGFVTHDQVSKLFQQTDIFVMPSVVHSSGDRDGIPLVLMEALLHRVPVVATSVSGIPELVTDGLTGLLIPEKNPAAIVEAVRTLASDREAALVMAETGRSKIIRQFDPRENYRRVYELYMDLDRPAAGKGK